MPVAVEHDLTWNFYKTFTQDLPNNLDVTFSGELSVCFPVILVKGILNGNDGIVLDECLVEGTKLVWGQLKGEIQGGELI